MAKKLILSKADTILEGIVESALMELSDDDNSIVDSIKKEYIKDCDNSIIYRTVITLFDFSLDLTMSKNTHIDPVLQKLDTLNKIFKLFKVTCKKIEAEGYKTDITFTADSITIEVKTMAAVTAKPIKVKPELTLRKFEMQTNSVWISSKCEYSRTFVPDCYEHYIIDCLGGIDCEEYNELLESFKKPIEEVKIISGQVGEVYNRSRMKIIGWETPMPTSNYDIHFLRSADCFKVTIQDIKSKRKYKMYGYLFKETEKEFKKRICEYAEKAIDVMHKMDYTRDRYIPYTIGTHFMETEYALCEAQQILEKYDTEESCEASSAIIEKCEEHAFRLRQLKNGRRY